MKKESNPEKILVDCVKQESAVFAWYVFNDHIIKAKLKIKTIRLDREQVLFDVPQESIEYIKQMISGEGKMNFMIPDHSLLFSSELKSFGEDNILYIGLPEKTMMFERRQGDDRISPDIAISIKFNFKSKEYLYICHDLSEGGLSIIFPKRERLNFQKGDMIEKIELGYGGNNLSFKAEVTNVLKLKPYMVDSHPYGGTRVSFKFIDISPESLHGLQKIIKGHKKLFDDLLGR